MMNMENSVKMITIGDSKFFEESVNVEKIKTLLDGSSHNAIAGIRERTQAMKWLLAIVSKGRDASQFFPDVVKNIIVKSVELKKLVYVFIMHYADHDDTCREIALLSINSFQKDLTDKNELIRALALRTMTSIRVKDITQLQLLAVQKCAGDSSAYVRKTAAHAIAKVYRLNSSTKDELIGILETLLNDVSTMVVGSAIFAFEEVCPFHYDLIHPMFRGLCTSLVDFDEWGQVAVLNILIRYSRQHFVRPNVEATNADEEVVKDYTISRSNTVAPTAAQIASFYDESDSDENEALTKPTPSAAVSDSATTQSMEPDHRMVLNCVLPLLHSRNASVVLGATSLLWHCGKRSRVAMESIATSIVRILNFSEREITFYVLNVILPMVVESAGFFKKYFEHFYIKDSLDSHPVRMLKLDILTLLADEPTVPKLLQELESYVLHADKKFAAASIRAVGRLVNQFPETADLCLEGLVTLMSSQHADVVAEAVVVSRSLLQQHESFIERVIKKMIGMLPSITVPSARASIIWLISESIPKVAELAVDSLRCLCKDFAVESDTVKMQAVHLAVRMDIFFTHDPSAKQMFSEDSYELAQDSVHKLLGYILELAKYDMSVDVRDRARFVEYILENPELDSSVLTPSKPTPIIPRVESSMCADVQGQYRFDSLSHQVGYAVKGYRELPDWPSTMADPSKRNITATRRYTKTTTLQPPIAKLPDPSSFYDESDSDKHDDESDSDNSSSSSGSSSSNGESSSSSGHSSSSSSDSEDSSSSSSEDTDSGDDTTPEVKSVPQSTARNDEIDLLNLYEDYGPSTSSTNQNISSLTDSLSMVHMMDNMDLAKGIQRKTLLSPVHGDGLHIEYQLTRSVSHYSDSMTLISLFFLNTKALPFCSIKVTKMKLENGQQMIPFPEICNIAPKGKADAMIHVDFNGKANKPCKFSVSTDRGVFPVELPCPPGELFVPDFKSMTDRGALQSRLGGMHEASKRFDEKQAAFIASLDTSARIQHVRGVVHAAVEVDDDTTFAAGMKRSDNDCKLLVRLKNDEIRVGCDDFVTGTLLLDEFVRCLFGDL